MNRRNFIKNTALLLSLPITALATTKDNKRTALRLNRLTDEWEPIKFEEIKKYDTFMLREPTGELVSFCGVTTKAVANSNPYYCNNVLTIDCTMTIEDKKFKG